MRREFWTLLGFAVLACSALGQQPPGGGGGALGPGAGGPSGFGGGVSQRATPLNPTQRDRLSEDIEVMRRLLESDLRSIYGYPAAMAWDVGSSPHMSADLNRWLSNVGPQVGVNLNDWPHSAVGANRNFAPVFTDVSNSVFAQQHKDPHGQLLLPSAEGSYLPGYGVVYTMTLPLPLKETKSEPAKPAKKPLSAWERARRELRGEPMEAEQPAEQRPPSVSGTILKVLAENGQHFSQLKENEQITVAVTYRSKWGSNVAQCTACHVVPHTGMGGMGSAEGMGSGAAGPAGMAGMGAGARSGGSLGPAADGDAGGGAIGPPSQPGTGAGPGIGAPGAGGSGGPGFRPGGGAGGGNLGDGGSGGHGAGSSKPWEDRMLLGDLHLKNGRTKDALAEYGKAAEVLENLMGHTWNWDKQQLKSAEELYGKLIQAHLAIGDRAAARAVLDKFDKIPPLNPVVAAQTPGKPKTEAPKPIVLPGKLIVTAPKRLLDQVGSGKISFEEFRKSATVE